MQGNLSARVPNIGNAGLTDVTGNGVPGGMTYPDAKVTSTLLRWGNYDYFNRVARFQASEVPSGVPAPTDQVLPKSVLLLEPPGLVPCRLGVAADWA